MVPWNFNYLPDFLLKFGPPIGTFLVHVPILSIIFYHRLYFGKTAEKLFFGWMLLFLANIATFGMGWITDFFAVFAKTFIFYGVRDYDFIVATQRIQDEMTPKKLPADSGYEKEGKLNIILYTQSHASYTKQVNFVEKLVLENLKTKTNTTVFAFQDTIPHKELRKLKWINPERVFIFLYSASSEKVKNEFTIFPMDLTKIGFALSETAKMEKRSDEKHVVIFSNLSLLIHLFGPYPVYTMLLNKRGTLREKGIDVYAFMNPKTHEANSTISLFTDIADDVIKL
jgi:hypothetical protein